MKPDIVDVLEILHLKKVIKTLNEDMDQRVAAIAEECGAGRFDYALSELPPQDEEGLLWPVVDEMKENGQWFKFEITHNVKKLLAGEMVWTGAYIKALSVTSMTLKRLPESLK